MRIIRFLDDAGRASFGVPAEDGTAKRLRGDPLTGLQPEDVRVPIRTLLAPVFPVNIFCIGLNYPAHAAETGASIPEHPVVFMKPTSALNHPGAPIVIPASCVHGPEVDFEAELAVVIKRHARNVPEHEALDYVLG